MRIRRTIDNESLGIRLHEVNRQRAVDRAIDRMRHGLHADWHYLTADDHVNLRWVLGELWATSNRDHWEQYHFSKLDFDQARRLATMGDRMRRRHTQGITSLESAAELVRMASAASNSEESRFMA